MRKTEWYPGTVKPVRVGFYETSPTKTATFTDFWTGKNWTTENGLFLPRKYIRYWRGLTEEQK